MDLPLNVQTGLVTGRYIVDVVDGPDENLDPDAQPVRGQIVFTASVPYLPNPTAAPDPVTIMRAPIVGVLDADGYLCTPYQGSLEPLYRGVRLIATDDPDIAVTDWTWDVTYIFEPINGHKLAIPAHGFSLPSGETVDLTRVAKVPSSPGYSLPQAEAAVLRAEAIAQSIRDDADAGLFNGEAATLEIGAVSSGTSAEVVNVGDEQHAILNITLEKGDKGDTGNGVPDAGEAFQLIRMDEIAGTTEWVTPSKELVGLAQVDNTADADKPVSGPVELALAEKADAGQVSEALSLKADTSVVDSIAPTGGVRAVGKGELVVNVRDFGAVGDNITDDTQAIQNAINSLPNEGGRGGGTVLFDSGNYRITSTLVVANHGVHLRSSGAYTAVITPAESVVGFAILYEIPNSAVRGPRLSDLRINCAGSSAGGLRIAAAYDNAILENVFVSGLNDGATGIELSPNPGASTLVSQTIVATNVWASGSRGARKHTGKCWYLDAVQEAVFVGCKGLAGGETSGTAWHIKGVKGVVFTGCSAAFAAIGFVIDSTDRAQSGITIDTPTLESVGQTMVTTGGNMTSYMSFRNPRSQVGETLPAGPITLNNVADSTFELHNIILNIGATAERIHALTVNKSNVTDNGINSTVIQWANYLNPYTVNSFAVERASTPYMRMSVAGRNGYHQMQWGASATADNGYQHQYNDGSINRYVHRVNGAVSTQTWFGYASGASTEIFKIDRNPAANKAGAYLFINDGSTLALKQVEVGAIDSGGTGFRSLRIAN